MVVPVMAMTVIPLPADDGLMVPAMLPDEALPWEALAAPLDPTLEITVAALGRISQMLRLYRSVIGHVSLMVIMVPLSGVGALWLWTQYVSFVDERS